MAASISKVTLLLCSLPFVPAQDLFLANPTTKPSPDKIMVDLFHFWEAFRDPDTGVYCDGNRFNQNKVCGQGDMYSSAGTGMGLIAECVFAEMGLLSRANAESNVRQTLATIRDAWPREEFHGFYAHFTQRQPNGTITALSEYSTVDTAEMMLGALFAGNYFGGDVNQTAFALSSDILWTDALEGADSPTIFPVTDPDTGRMSGNIRPFNEYYLVAYIAKMFDSAPNGTASQYFDTYMGVDGKPAGRNGIPVDLAYSNHSLLTDPSNHFMSSFIPQFCYFQSKGFHTNSYYSQTLLPAWLQADMDYWASILDDSSKVWGHPVRGKVFGCGAGPGHDKGYTVNRINGTEEPIFSAAIMAGFLGVATPAQRKSINQQLGWLYNNDVCTYTKTLPSGLTPKVSWRCSISNPDWRAGSADSIDFSTLVLGYATNFVRNDFYATFAF